jgi:protein tyrosine/serine phosphatase
MAKEKDREKLYPPLNFAGVEAQLYRSATPTELNLPFLATLHLCTVVCLEKTSLTDEFIRFMDEKHITCVSFGGGQAEGGLLETVVRDTLQIILDKSKYPVLITCKFGRYLSGVVIGCLRKYQKWSFISIFEEYRRFGGLRYQQPHEQFIELFDTDLVTPDEASVPRFLEGCHI